MGIVANAVHISEFSTSSHGEGFHGTCTEASAAMILTAANGLSTDYQTVVDLMVDIRDVMYTEGNASANGAANFADIGNELRRRLADIHTEWDYQGDSLPQDWISYLRANAGIKPIMVQLANAQGLVNIAGAGEDAGVHYHAIAILGKSDTGYIVGDPNNPNVVNDFDTYPLWALQDAQVCALIALNVKEQPQVQPQEHTAMTIPTNWRDDGTTLTAPNGLVVTGGFRDNVLATNWQADNLPGENEAHFDPIRRQRFALGTFYADISQHTIWYQSVDATEGEGRLLDIRTANKAIADLETQLAAVKAQLAQVPPPQPLANKQAEDALNTFTAIFHYAQTYGGK